MLAFFNFLAYNKIADRDVLYTCVIELTFKRYVISPNTRPPSGGFFGEGNKYIHIF